MALRDTLLGLEAKGWKTTESFSGFLLSAGGMYPAMFGHRTVGLSKETAQLRLDKVATHVLWHGANKETPNIYVATVVPVAPVTLKQITVALGAEFGMTHPEPVAEIPLILLPAPGEETNTKLASDMPLEKNKWVYLYLFLEEGTAQTPTSLVRELHAQGYHVMYPPSGLTGLLVDDSRFAGAGYVILMLNPGDAEVAPAEIEVAGVLDAEAYTNPRVQGLQPDLSIVYYAKRGETALSAGSESVAAIIDTTANLATALSDVTAEASRATAGLATVGKGLFWAAMAIGLGYVGYRFYRRYRKATRPAMGRLHGKGRR